jgi:hypothetical protein
MKLDDVMQLSPENWLALMPILFKRRGYKIEGCMLRLKSKRAQHLAYCLPTIATLSLDELEKWFHAGDHLDAAFGYVVTQGRFCPEVKAHVVPWETELVEGTELQKWLRLAALP